MTRNNEAESSPDTTPTPDASNQVPAYPDSAASTSPKVPSVPDGPGTKRRTLAGSTWVSMIIGALLLILLLVFIMQNQHTVDLTLFAWEFTVPAGVGVLLAAIAGALIMALVGGVRMLELRRELKKLR
ncbi:LapA family protein [Corynebacterium pygosceleis]|uniref:Lipopolysaccharide assembly protein LapA domain-containing protein n=1 Tax=Corynebacterium pygosceleis TaxID=2800406 RepID=A0A9Q4GHM3_9CORY|nr:lipopolysaccharide assembly protein LapA domain-containing protein [Corynebacterium pygosceleis]MCK7636770.1 lipopolysaccharide assembly protein LapA domain-containing protein [Corynebacterium pygosceleis]MCK7674244.1 lipopolysaccharide assembly protein LapA domain-containing protein [Corynebacterium pygosceleis]MCL0120458.1 lipopolysaccharide assembly protein LapA domain-containing protein [Corynebacterium pygosceleis]MCX7467523.1 lipopolysaccharide assembly protein LapA domain-containing p